MNKNIIYIIEDNPKQRQRLKDMILKEIFEELDTISITLVKDSPTKLIEGLEKNNETQSLYFIDIDLGTSINGIDLAQKIRQKQMSAMIVFFTSHNEQAKETMYTFLGALGILDKNAEDSSIQDALRKTITIARKRWNIENSDKEQMILFETQNGKVRINTEDIIMIEPSANMAHYSVIYLKTDQQYEVKGQLNSFELLSPSFIKTHRSNIINIKYVQKINKKKRFIHLSCELTAKYAAAKYQMIIEMLERKE